MLDNLIQTGESYKDKFTTEYNLGVECGIDSELENEYLQWLSKVGVFSEANLRGAYPDMTKKIVSIVCNKSIMVTDYNIIMGYLKSSKELGY